MKIDPIHQFNIEPLFTIGHIGKHTIAFTNSSLYMFITVAVISLLMIGGMARGQLVPGRLQSIAEISYEFVASMIRSTAGAEGMKFFPLIFSLFMFICISNLIGIIPYTFTVSSHIIVTAALALLVLLHGPDLRRSTRTASSSSRFSCRPAFRSTSCRWSCSSKSCRSSCEPVSHSVRLFANMLAGHIALKVFAGFVAMLGVSLGALGWVGGMLPLALTVALTALELLVAFLQAYVFAMLTCIYLNDAIHPGH